MKAEDSKQLCLECGMCCNGVIFASGQLQPGDDAARLQAWGLKLLSSRKPEAANRKFRQPCAAFDGCRCGIYSNRPEYCRQFECLLLKNVLAGQLEADAARRVIHSAHQRADKVKCLLRDLGDADGEAALSLRFRRVKRRVESGELDEKTADLFGQLSLAVHDLNYLLSESLYPGG